MMQQRNIIPFMLTVGVITSTIWMMAQVSIWLLVVVGLTFLFVGGWTIVYYLDESE